MENTKEGDKNMADERKDINEGDKNIFNTWIESYTAISKMWEESYIKLYKPWLESTGELLEKAIEVSGTNSPDKYREFYDVWAKTFQGRLDKLGNVPTLESNKKILERLLTSAEKSTDIYRSWIVELEENSKKTREALQGETDPIKYKEIYDLWIKSYAKIFDELLTLPFRENIREIFESYTGVPDIYSDTFIKISRLWNDTYTKLYESWINAILELSKKSEEISKGNTGPEAYREFYSLWTNVYQQTYGKLLNIQSVQNSKEIFENFAQGTTVHANLYKSWITTLEKLSQKSKELANSDKNVSNDVFNLWIRVYQKVFDSFFDNIPTAGPFKETLIPVKTAAKIYIDTLSKISDAWVQSYGRVSKV